MLNIVFKDSGGPFGIYIVFIIPFHIFWSVFVHKRGLLIAKLLILHLKTCQFAHICAHICYRIIISTEWCNNYVTTRAIGYTKAMWIYFFRT